MLRLIGQSAHSEFRLASLSAKLIHDLPQLVKMGSHYEYFIDINDELNKEEQQVLNEILAATSEPFSNKNSLWVLPRFGTQSAWGSKAIELLHHIGLKKVKRIEKAIVYQFDFGKYSLSSNDLEKMMPLIHDRMTEMVITQPEDAAGLFAERTPQPLQTIPVIEQGIAALIMANEKLGLALSKEEIHYLANAYSTLNRNPTDVELMMFAQANSEHCRHKIFKAHWEIDGQAKKRTLFGMIKNTFEHHSTGILSAYLDNAAVVAGFGKKRFFCDTDDNTYQFHETPVHFIMKVETHNHPTAIEPYAGAGTGQGGEIRDEGATGRGGKPKAGLTGFHVSHLHIPKHPLPWESESHYPSRIASALEIMLKAPLGGAAFNNEFGRPNLCGYFRTFEQPFTLEGEKYFARGYHKPVMIAGGLGNIAEEHIQKKNLNPGALLIVLGGPAMKIGLGGGAASSKVTGTNDLALDFASVQRQNPEMQRRCQEVIDRCWALKERNPILSIHDVGAGGLANALPELVHDSQRGAQIDLRNIPNAEYSMTPMELWCNESQERYVLAISKQSLDLFGSIAWRERCPFAVLGVVTANDQLTVTDQYFENKPIDLPLGLLFGQLPALSKKAHTVQKPMTEIQITCDFSEIIQRVLHHPTVADKTFLITIGDRTVGGLTARDQMVGPWQVPVADCAVTATNFIDVTGEAMAMGERSPLATLNPKACAKMAVAEAILNILAADVSMLSQIRLSCNWMCDANFAGDDADLFAAVQAVGEELCPAWNITIPVGKDSLSMRTSWQQNQRDYEVIAPLTLVVSAFAPIQDIRKTYTPLLTAEANSCLLFIDLAQGNRRLGGSIFAQVTLQQGGTSPDVDSPWVMEQFMKALNQLKAKKLLHAYHDRSDGGLWVTLCEMAFASRCGLEIDLSELITSWEEAIPLLFNEELGVVIQVLEKDFDEVQSIFAQEGLNDCVYKIARKNKEPLFNICFQGKNYYSNTLRTLLNFWSRTSYEMQRLRDNPETAKEALENSLNNEGLFVKQPESKNNEIIILKNKKPKIAILREQGVNGHFEMAGAFTLAGFEAIDVTMNDLMYAKDLKAFHGLAACGGFSYGDVLGAGLGWAKSILYQSRLRDIFSAFFERTDTFALGVCNGCQMLSGLRKIIPGAENWPTFKHNISEQFEARLCSVQICDSNSILLNNMQGQILPIVVSHGEGRVDLEASNSPMVTLRYVDSKGNPTQKYPHNPNGSLEGMAGFTTTDGRVTIMMPHPERVFKSWQLSWHPKEWGENSPWMQLFNNARNWLK